MLVGAVVVVAVGREVALDEVVDGEAGVVAERSHLRVLDRRQDCRRPPTARRCRRPWCGAPGGRAAPSRALVGVLVVHVVDDVERVDVGLGQPVQHPVERGHRRRRSRGPRRRTGALGGATCSPVISSRPPLIAYSSALARLTRAPKNCICLPDRASPRRSRRSRCRRRSAGACRSSDSYWIGAGVDRHLGAEPLEALGQLRRPQHRQVRLGRRAEVVERLQVAEGGAGDERPPVLADAADATRSPRSGRRRTARRTRGCAGTGRSAA